LFNNVVELHRSEHGSLFITWESHEALFWVAVKIEGKALISKITCVKEGWEVVNRDGSISKS